MTIDLSHYWDGIRGEVNVTVGVEVIDCSGESREHLVEGKVPLCIPSFEEKLAKLKATPRPRGLPIRLFDVSDSTGFDHL